VGIEGGKTNIPPKSYSQSSFFFILFSKSLLLNFLLYKKVTSFIKSFIKIVFGLNSS